MRVRMPAARTAVVARTVRLGRFRLRSFIALRVELNCLLRFFHHQHLDGFAAGHEFKAGLNKLIRIGRALHLVQHLFHKLGLKSLLLAVVFQLGWRQDGLQCLGFLVQSPLLGFGLRR